MQFGFTIPLMKHLKMKNLPYGEPVDLFFCWELHNINLHGKSSLIVINANNRFAVVLRGMKRKEWNGLSRIAEDSIAAGLREEGWSDQEIDFYFRKAGEISLTKTHGRKPVSALNKAVEYLQYLPIEMEDDSLYQKEASHMINREICRAAGFESRGYSADFLKEDMARLQV